MAPTLFSILSSAMLTFTFTGDVVAIIELRSRTDDGFYKTDRLKDEIKVILDILRDLFADDCALCAFSEREMQHMIDVLCKS